MPKILLINKRVRSLLTLTAGLLLLTACGDYSTQADLNDYIKNLKDKMAPKQEKKERELFIMPTKTVYQQEKERSPFGAKQIFSVNKPGNPLQQYSLSMLHFMGTLTENKIIYGYILAPDNLIYPVKTGDLIGDHSGVVTKVDVDRVEIMEEVNEAGKPATQRIITLQLKDEL